MSLVTEDSVTLKARIAAHALDLAVVFDADTVPAPACMPLFRQRLYLVDRKTEHYRALAKKINLQPQ